MPAILFIIYLINSPISKDIELNFVYDIERFQLFKSWNQQIFGFFFKLLKWLYLYWFYLFPNLHIL